MSLEKLELIRANILIAYPYFKKKVKEELEILPRDSYRLMVDSGAFTAFNSGKAIRLDDYCAFLDSISSLKPFKAVQLDVVGEPSKTLGNLSEMARRGYNVMPVFTRNELLSNMDKYYEFSDYICAAGFNTHDKKLEYAKAVMRHAKGRKVHLLALVTTDSIKKLAPESMDSSTWSVCRRFGLIALYKGNGEVYQVSKKEFFSYPKASLVENLERLRLEPHEWRVLAKSSSWTAAGMVDLRRLGQVQAGFVTMISVASHLLRAHEVEKRTGTKIYLALGDAESIRQIRTAQEFLSMKGF
jgi:hypothetical protein